MNSGGRRQIFCGMASTSSGQATTGLITVCFISLQEKAVVVLSHGLTKEREVPPREVDQAVERKRMVEADFEKFTFKPE
jgi:hypothetical protein